MGPPETHTGDFDGWNIPLLKKFSETVYVTDKIIIAIITFIYIIIIIY